MSDSNNDKQGQSTLPQLQQPKAFSKKNWDKIIEDFEKEEEEHKSVNDLFKEIYQGGNEEVRRAMNKSYQESGGTVLSTNWENVAHETVKPKPPSTNDNNKEGEV